MSDLWDNATRDHTEERIAALHTAARVSTVDLWSHVLATASTRVDFENRLATIGDRLDSVCSSLTEDPSEFIELRAKLNDSFVEDFEHLANIRMDEAQRINAPRAYARNKARIAADDGNHVDCPDHPGQSYNKSTGDCSCGANHHRFDGGGPSGPHTLAGLRRTTASDIATCGNCGLSWDDSISTSWTPAPSGRCPFEYFHPEDGGPLDPDEIPDDFEVRPIEGTTAKLAASQGDTSTCSKCGDAITYETDRWVSSASGDDGGTYDICEEGGSHSPGTTARKHASYTWEPAVAGDIKPGDVWRWPEDGSNPSMFQADNASWDAAFGDNPVGRGAGQVSREMVGGEECVRIDTKDGRTNLGVFPVNTPVEIARRTASRTARQGVTCNSCGHSFGTNNNGVERCPQCKSSDLKRTSSQRHADNGWDRYKKTQWRVIQTGTMTLTGPPYADQAAAEAAAAAMNEQYGLNGNYVATEVGVGDVPGTGAVASKTAAIDWQGQWSLGKQSETYFEGEYKGMHCETRLSERNGKWCWSFYDDNSPEPDLAVARNESGFDGDFDTREAAEADLIDYIDSYVDGNMTASKKTAATCSCARHNDGSVTTMLCPLHADDDPCATMAAVTGERRRGSIIRGVCSACGWTANKTASKLAYNEWQLPLEGAPRQGPMLIGDGGKFTAQCFIDADKDTPSTVHWWVEVWPKPQYEHLERRGTSFSPSEAMRMAEKALSEIGGSNAQTPEQRYSKIASAPEGAKTSTCKNCGGSIYDDPEGSGWLHSDGGSYACDYTDTEGAEPKEGSRRRTAAGTWKIEESIGTSSGQPMFTLYYMGGEDSFGYGVWEPVKSFSSRADAEAFQANPPEWWGNGGTTGAMVRRVWSGLSSANRQRFASMSAVEQVKLARRVLGAYYDDLPQKALAVSWSEGWMRGFNAGRLAARNGMRSLASFKDTGDEAEGFRAGVMAQHRMGEFRKGAPFADYEDFDACVKANSDKEDPEAYCGKIKHQTEDKKAARKTSSKITEINAWADGFGNWHVRVETDGSVGAEVEATEAARERLYEELEGRTSFSRDVVNIALNHRDSQNGKLTFYFDETNSHEGSRKSKRSAPTRKHAEVMPPGSVQVRVNPKSGTSKDGRIDVMQTWGPTYATTIYEGYDASAAQAAIDAALTKARATQEGKDAKQFGTITTARRKTAGTPRDIEPGEEFQVGDEVVILGGFESGMRGQITRGGWHHSEAYRPGQPMKGWYVDAYGKEMGPYRQSEIMKASEYDAKGGDAWWKGGSLQITCSLCSEVGHAKTCALWEPPPFVDRRRTKRSTGRRVTAQSMVHIWYTDGGEMLVGPFENDDAAEDWANRDDIIDWSEVDENVIEPYDPSMGHVNAVGPDGQVVASRTAGMGDTYSKCKNCGKKIVDGGKLGAGTLWYHDDSGEDACDESEETYAEPDETRTTGSLNRHVRRYAAVSPDQLNDIAEFDHVFRVTEDGDVEDVPGEYAPSVHFFGGEDGQMDGDPEIDGSGWDFVTGYSGQDRYSGPVMHSSEFLGGGMARDVLSDPGVYVVTTVEDMDDPENPAGWVLLKKTSSRRTAASKYDELVGRGYVGFPGSEILAVRPMWHDEFGSWQAGGQTGVVTVKTMDGRTLDIPTNLDNVRTYDPKKSAKLAELGEPVRTDCPKCGTAQYNPAAGACSQCGAHRYQVVGRDGRGGFQMVYVIVRNEQEAREKALSHYGWTFVDSVLDVAGFKPAQSSRRQAERQSLSWTTNEGRASDPSDRALRTHEASTPAFAGATDEDGYYESMVYEWRNGTFSWSVYYLGPNGGESLVEEGDCNSVADGKDRCQRVVNGTTGMFSRDDLAAEGHRTAGPVDLMNPNAGAGLSAGDRVRWDGDQANVGRDGTVTRVDGGWADITWDEPGPGEDYRRTTRVPTAIVDSPRWKRLSHRTLARDIFGEDNPFEQAANPQQGPPMSQQQRGPGQTMDPDANQGKPDDPPSPSRYNAKVHEIYSGIVASNPNLDPATALKLASQTVARFPAMVKSAGGEFCKKHNQVANAGYCDKCMDERRNDPNCKHPDTDDKGNCADCGKKVARKTAIGNEAPKGYEPTGETTQHSCDTCGKPVTFEWYKTTGGPFLTLVPLDPGATSDNFGTWCAEHGRGGAGR